MCVCVKETERERECVCVCVCDSSTTTSAAAGLYSAISFKSDNLTEAQYASYVSVLMHNNNNVLHTYHR